MRLDNSPFSENFLQKAYGRFNEAGSFWGSLILLTGCYTITNDRFLFMKFGFSGSGKTISDKVALFWAQRFNPITISSRITPAGLAKLFRKSKNDSDFLEQFAKFYNTNLILLEDLSKGTTKYLRTTTISFLAGLTKSSTMDDLTSEGGGLDIKLSELPKKCMLSGTPSQYEELTSTDIFTEHVDRRSITITSLLNDIEWDLRKQLAFKVTAMADDNLIEYWKNIISTSYSDAKISFCEDNDKTIQMRDALYRKIVFEKLMKIKGFPENVMFMVDSLAKGHALLNGRRKIMEEDYEILDKLFSRFLYLSDMKKKEFLVVEEVLRNRGSTGVNIDDLVYLLRMRSKSENIPEAEVVRKTIQKYVDCSKYLTTYSIPDELSTPVFDSSSFRKIRKFVDISDHLKSIFNSWNVEMKEILQ